MILAVVDTNVLVSALLWGGKPLILLRHPELQLVLCSELAAELAEVLARPKFKARIAAKGLTATELVASVGENAIFVTPHPQLRVCRDPDDDIVIATALAGGAHWVVSGDEDLLALGHVGGVACVGVDTALARLAGA